MSCRSAKDGPMAGSALPIRVTLFGVVRLVSVNVRDLARGTKADTSLSDGYRSTL